MIKKGIKWTAQGVLALIFGLAMLAVLAFTSADAQIKGALLLAFGQIITFLFRKGQAPPSAAK